MGRLGLTIPSKNMLCLLLGFLQGDDISITLVDSTANLTIARHHSFRNASVLLPTLHGSALLLITTMY